MIKVGTLVTLLSLDEIKKRYSANGHIYVDSGWAGGMTEFLGKDVIVTNRIIPTEDRFSIEGTNLIFSIDMVESYTNIITVGCRYGMSSVDIEDKEATDYAFKVYTGIFSTLNLGDIVVANDKNGIRLLTVTNLEMPKVSHADAVGEVIQKVDLDKHLENMKED